MNTFRFIAIAGSALLAASSFAATAANAQIVSETSPGNRGIPVVTRTATIKIDRYELASAVGRASALARIKSAATSLCVQQMYVTDSHGEQRRCEREFTENMVRQTKSSVFFALWKHEHAIETASRN